MTAMIPVFASTLGQIFEPIFHAMAWLLAFFYALVPNYAIAIAILTVVVMIVTAPLTIKSTKSMMAMSRLSPEIKKLQQKYKGDRQKLNEEMMNLYREHGVNPAGGCLPMVIQFPVFIVLYDVIKGLTNTVKQGQEITTSVLHRTCHQTVCADPRYIAPNTRLYRDLVKDHGTMPAFGINLADKVLGHHSLVQALPYIGLVLVAIALQYFQMRQLNSRNPAMAQANPQAQMMQRYMPLIFAVIYINIAAGVNIYFIVSSLCRIGIQEFVFRSGALDRAGKPKETRVAGTAPPRKKGLMERLADAQRQAIEAQQARQAALQAGDDTSTGGNGNARPGAGGKTGKSGTSRTPGTAGKSGTGGAAGTAGRTQKPGPGNGNRRPSQAQGEKSQPGGTGRTSADKAGSGQSKQNQDGRTDGSVRASGNGDQSAERKASGDGKDDSQPQARSKAKRTRKAR